MLTKVRLFTEAISKGTKHQDHLSKVSFKSDNLLWYRDKALKKCEKSNLLNVYALWRKAMLNSMLPNEQTMLMIEHTK